MHAPTLNPASQEVSNLLRSRHTLLWIVTAEERRVEATLADVAAAAAFHVRFWDCATGVSDVAGDTVALPSTISIPATVPLAPLAAARLHADRTVWVFRDLGPWLQDPGVLRMLRTAARDLQDVRLKSQFGALIVLSPTADLPASLRDVATIVEWPLPNRDELTAILANVVANNPTAATALRDPESLRACSHIPPEDAAVLDQVIDDALLRDAGDLELQRPTTAAIVDAATGLSAEQAANAFARSVVQTRTLDPGLIATEKKRSITREGLLTWVDPDPRGLDGVGGLERLKTWLRARSRALTPEARDYGLPAPRGVLFVGLPGCGKSLMAKAVSVAFGIPALRLDPGALKASLVGESEARIRRALAVAQACAPVVLWIDELDKALAGGTGAGDSGVSADQLGTLLTWLQDHTGFVFLVATANDVGRLPPELLRRGRFDEIFFVDLPTETERAAILAAALRTHRRDPDAFDLRAIAGRTHQFSGAEIAELVPEALHRAFGDDRREPTTSDLLAAADATIPYTRHADSRLEAIREWASKRAKPASEPELTTAPSPQSTGIRSFALDNN